MNNYDATHPASIFKFCPQCGQVQFTFDGEKLFVCSHCRLNYYINPAPAVCGIIELPDGRIILTRRKYNPQAGKLDLPGGFVDINERAEDALMREIHEELGIHIHKLHFLATFPNEYVFKGLSYFTCDIAFICKLDHIPVIKPADDVSEAIIVQPDTINFDEICFPSIIHILKRYLG
jgi:ADP-ribose pyrophosphatase YjhB (NUDIX family)